VGINDAHARSTQVRLLGRVLHGIVATTTGVDAPADRADKTAMMYSTADPKDVAEQSFNRLPDGREIETEQIDGGVLVFADADKPGRELIGFAAVSSYDDIRRELIRRGLGVGAIHNKPEFDIEEVGGR